jgi:hypothetical protein
VRVRGRFTSDLSPSRGALSLGSELGRAPLSRAPIVGGQYYKKWQVGLETTRAQIFLKVVAVRPHRRGTIQRLAIAARDHIRGPLWSQLRCAQGHLAVCGIHNIIAALRRTQLLHISLSSDKGSQSEQFLDGSTWRRYLDVEPSGGPDFADI